MEKTPVIASIDVGTNSFHMVVASVDAKGMLNILAREKESVRLGSGSTDMKYLKEDAIERGVLTLRRFGDIARSYNADIYAIATSAVREANNKEDFTKQVKKEAGINVEVVSGYEEGRLIYNGVIHALPVYNKKLLVIDIGGGSTETIIGYQGRPEYIHSEKIGAIRLTRRFFSENGKKEAENIEICRDYIKGEWSPILKKINDRGFESVVITSGTLQTLAAMSLAIKGREVPELLNGITISSNHMLKAIDKLLNAGSAEKRASLPGMDPGRADIIIPGALIIEYAIKYLGFDKLTVSTFALREGLVFDIIQKLKSINEFPHLSHLRLQTIYNLCHRYNVEMPHAEYVKETALSIFDQLKPLHGLGPYERELLEAASLLHDVGYHISHDKHHQHSYYIIVNSMMPGFTNDESEMIANIARYHRKSHPKNKHENFNHLSSNKKKIIRLLSGILRISEGIDRRQMQLIESLNVKINGKHVDILLSPADGLDPEIEIWGANRRKPLLEETLDKNISINISDKL